MFTGLVEGKGTLLERQAGSASSRLRIELGPLSEGVRLGDSIAVNGCCLTVTEVAGSQATFDLLRETELRTNLHATGSGAVVNLERALPAHGRYGGHFVTGHIDATGMILQWEQVGKDYLLRLSLKREERSYVVPKGCIALDGISLTVAEVADDFFTVWIIPHTREVTALAHRQVGETLNLEFDLLAKYVEKILAVRAS